ncbi:MAG: response regulator [Lachnospiraceae bacterium]|nr:response regulator [Lachnospiraceae bacterium]
MMRLILVDDEMMFLDSLSRYIRQNLTDVEICGCFHNGKAALEYMMVHSADVDVVLTDICMPQMDGLALSREICTRFPHCVIIIISGYADFEYARTAIKYNVLNYILKPFEYQNLKQYLQEASELSAARRRLHYTIDLAEEATELFFADVFLDTFHSDQQLEEAFEKFNFPFTLDNSSGYLIKFTIDQTSALSLHYPDLEQFSHSLKNILQFSQENTFFYFFRKSTASFYFVAIGVFPDATAFTEQIAKNVKDVLKLSCQVDLYHSFQSLKDFVSPNHKDKVPEISSRLSDNTQIQQAANYIQANYNHDITREQVAKIVYMSPSYFSYQFKKEMGISFVDYLTTVRMQNAVELLKTAMPIKDISTAVGYQNISRFYTNFRHYTSYAPSDYRKKILSMEIFNEDET